MWRAYPHPEKIEGVELEGDPEMPPTRWWNHLYLALVKWRVLTIFETPEKIAGPYHVGYIDWKGRAKYDTKLRLVRKFAMLHGREACRFFAVTNDGIEIPLKVRHRTTVDRLPVDVTLV